MTNVVRFWEGVAGQYPIPPKFQAVRIRRDGWPDQRFKIGKEMAAHFVELDRKMIEEAFAA